MDKFNINPSTNRRIIDYRKVGINGLVGIGHYDYHKAQEALSRHHHSDLLEICYLTDGEQFYEIEGSHYHMKKGDFLLISPWERHSTGEYPEQRGSLYWMLIESPEVSGNLLDLNAKDTKVLWEKLTDRSSRHFPSLRDLSNTLSQLLHYDNKTLLEDPFTLICFKHQFMDLLIEVVKAKKQIVHKKVSPLMKRISDIMVEEEYNVLGIEDFAKMSNLSVAHFSRRFKQELGSSPKDFINKYKIERACSLIKKGMPITDVAYELNFSNSQYFSVVFRRYKGCSPSQLKTNH